ncbi:MAG: hypothetical protein AAF723_06315, partial [Pseudomonadota bacterium]
RNTCSSNVKRSVGILSDILHDRDDGRFVVTKPLAKSFGDPAPLYISLLLQETILGFTPSDETSLKDRVTAQSAHILGHEDDVELVAFAIQHRDLLFRMASRRNVTDVTVVSQLGEIIQTERQLACLAIVTSCRHRTAGIRSWEEYAKRDVRLLVESIFAFLQNGEEGLTSFLHRRRQHLRTRARNMMAPEDVLSFDHFIERTGPTFWSMIDVPTAADLAFLVTLTDAHKEMGGALVQAHPQGFLQIIVYTDDVPGTFAAFAGLAAEIGGTVWGASSFPIFAMEEGHPKIALVFQINKAGALPGPFRLSVQEMLRVEEKCEALARGERPEPKIPPPVIGDRRAVFSVTPSLRIDSEMSDSALIVEVEVLDRPGLLYYVSAALAEISVSIQLAFVATYGHRAVDTFYLQDAPGYKITDERRIETIRRQILRALEE